MSVMRGLLDRFTYDTSSLVAENDGEKTLGKKRAQYAILNGSEILDILRGPYHCECTRRYGRYLYAMIDHG